jgi:hypothetical protein
VNPGVALASCIPNRSPDGQYHQVGYGSTGTKDLQGVKSQINIYHAYVRPNTAQEPFSYAWVMLTYPTNWKWAQIGPESKPGNLNYTTWSWAWGCVGCWDRTRVQPEPEGTTNEFKVTFNASVTDFKFWINGANLDSRNLGWNPTGALIHGETTDLAHQMMGDTSVFEGFGPNFYRLGDKNTPWTAATGARLSDSHYGIAGSAAAFGIWDLCP